MFASSSREADPCRLVRQVKKFVGYPTRALILRPADGSYWGLASHRAVHVLAFELVHLPHEAAGVEQTAVRCTS